VKGITDQNAKQINKNIFGRFRKRHESAGETSV
jgi:hypothetical protein